MEDTKQQENRFTKTKDNCNTSDTNEVLGEFGGFFICFCWSCFRGVLRLGFLGGGFVLFLRNKIHGITHPIGKF